MSDLTFRPAPKPEPRPKKAQKPLKRGGPIVRKTPPKRKTPIAKGGRIKVKPRTPSEKARIYGTAEHIAWMKSLPCAFCGIVGYSQVAHVRNGGMSKKAAAEFTVPACGPHPAFRNHDGVWFGEMQRGCHVVLDANKKSWRAMYDTDALAEKYAAAWQSHVGHSEGR